MKIKQLASAGLLTIMFAVPSLMARKGMVETVKTGIQSLQMPQSSIDVRNESPKPLESITVTWKITGLDKNNNSKEIKASQTMRNVPGNKTTSFNYTNAMYKKALIGDQFNEVKNVELISVKIPGASSENMEPDDKSTTFIVTEKDSGWYSLKLESQQQYNRRTKDQKKHDVARMQAVKSMRYQ